MREILQSVLNRKSVLEAKGANDPGEGFSSIATMLNSVVLSFTKGEISDDETRGKVKAIMSQYLGTMKDASWDLLRDTWTSGEGANTDFAKVLIDEYQTIPNHNDERQVAKLAMVWVKYMKKGGASFAKFIASRPGMKRLAPKPETVAGFDNPLGLDASASKPRQIEPDAQKKVPYGNDLKDAQTIEIEKKIADVTSYKVSSSNGRTSTGDFDITRDPFVGHYAFVNWEGPASGLKAFQDTIVSLFPGAVVKASKPMQRGSNFGEDNFTGVLINTDAVNLANITAPSNGNNVDKALLAKQIDDATGFTPKITISNGAIQVEFPAGYKDAYDSMQVLFGTSVIGKGPFDSILLKTYAEMRTAYIKPDLRAEGTHKTTSGIKDYKIFVPKFRTLMSGEGVRDIERYQEAINNAYYEYEEFEYRPGRDFETDEYTYRGIDVEVDHEAKEVRFGRMALVDDKKLKWVEVK